LVTGRKLLLADDSATIRKVVELTFSDEGLEVITVADGRQALEKLDEILPDIVLADVFMPEPGGYQASTLSVANVSATSLLCFSSALSSRLTKRRRAESARMII
jgi:CheY-like chemotaxis protein